MGIVELSDLTCSLIDVIKNSVSICSSLCQEAVKDSSDYLMYPVQDIMIPKIMCRLDNHTQYSRDIYW